MPTARPVDVATFLLAVAGGVSAFPRAEIDVAIVASVHCGFAKIPLSSDRKTGEKAPRLGEATLRAFSSVGVLGMCELLEF